MARQKSIRLKILSLIFASCLVIGLASVLATFSSSRSLKINTAEQLGEKRLAAVHRELGTVVDSVLSMLKYYQKQVDEGTLSLEKAQDYGKELVRAMRFDGNNYLWIHSYSQEAIDKPIMVMHPEAPQLIGKELENYKDMERYEFYNVDGTVFPQGDPGIAHITGVNLFIDMNRAIEASGDEQSGIVDYYWFKPGHEKNTAYLKTSVVKLFPDWGWVVGTGGYIDTIQADVANDIAPIAAELDNSKVLQIAAVVIVAVVMSLIGLAVTGIMKKSITGNVQRLRSMAEEGEVDIDIPQAELAREDELGQIAQACSSLSESLAQRCDVAAAIAEGDLRKDVQVVGDQDRLGIALSGMVEGLRSRMDILDREAQGLSTSANEITHASEGLSNGASDQAASTEEISATLTEVTSSAREAADAASKADSRAVEARDAGEAGIVKIEELNSAMGEIQEAMEDITKILGSIDGIAFQTNLLALNAAVEAARAGRHGKGFAVVADEVRALAGRSAAAAKESAQKITTTGERVQRGLGAATAVTESLREITEAISETASLVAQIAEATSQQAKAQEQVQMGINRIEGVTQSNAAQAEETAASALTLAKSASIISELVAEFKRPGSPEPETDAEPKLIS